MSLTLTLTLSLSLFLSLFPYFLLLLISHRSRVQSTRQRAKKYTTTNGTISQVILISERPVVDGTERDDLTSSFSAGQLWQSNVHLSSLLGFFISAQSWDHLDLNINILSTSWTSIATFDVCSARKGLIMHASIDLLSPLSRIRLQDI